MKGLMNTWDFINETADDNTKEMFELDDILYDISMKIFDYRTKMNLTQKQLAEKLGIKQAMVSKLESGNYNPTVELLWKISKKLNWDFKIIIESFVEQKTDIWDSVKQEANEKSEILNKEYQEKLAVGA